MHKKYFKNNQKGAAMLIVMVFFLFISLAIVVGLTSPAVNGSKIVTADLNSKLSYFLAESGVEDTFYREINGKNVSNNSALALGSNTTNTVISSLSGNKQQILSTGSASNFQRKVKMILGTGISVGFNYCVQMTQGGINLTNSASIKGNIYANGPITGDNSASIVGNVISGSLNNSLDINNNGTEVVPPYNVDFGDYLDSQDIAQTFKVNSSTLPLLKISFYIKKIGIPANAIVKIIDLSNSSSVLVSGTLVSSNVGTDYSWVDVFFQRPKFLTSSQTYLILIHPNSPNKNNYYNIATTTGNKYVNGTIQRSQSWAFPITGIDMYFRPYLGGTEGSISGVSGANQLQISGDAHAHNISYVNATKNFCTNEKENTPGCSSEVDYTYLDSPVSSNNIATWKLNALAGNGGHYYGYVPGNYGAVSFIVDAGKTETIGPIKITGDLIVNNGGTLIVEGDIWVGGSLSLGKNATIRLSSSYGSSDGVILVDGANSTINISDHGTITGSGSSNSYLMLVATNESLTSPFYAINLAGGSQADILYAPYGIINISGESTAKEVTGFSVSIDGSSSITYENALLNNNFANGPAGDWQLNSWKETQ